MAFAMRSVQRTPMIHGLVEVDVTRARAFLRDHKVKTGESLSFTAFIAMCLGKAVDENKAVQACRSRMSRFLSGSAAAGIANRLKREGARLVVPPESFFMECDVPPQGEKRRHEMERLEPGEELRAVDWALSILEQVGTAHKVDAGRESSYCLPS